MLLLEAHTGIISSFMGLSLRRAWAIVRATIQWTRVFSAVKSRNRHIEIIKAIGGAGKQPEKGCAAGYGGMMRDTDT